MELLNEVTSSHAPETPHERWFIDTYQPQIDRALERLKQPLDLSSTSSSAHQSASSAAWSGFRQLQHSLATRAAKRSALVLTVKDMSPGEEKFAISVLIRTIKTGPSERQNS